MPLKWRKKTILAKTETVYGTDVVPTGGANAIQASDVELTPFVGEVVQRENVRPFLGAFAKIHVGTRVQLAFSVEIAGAGAAGTAPAYGPLLRACGMAETITAGVSAAYDPVSANEESVTVHFFIDGQKHAMVGARGTLTIAINANQLPLYRFTLTGLFVAPAAAADPVPTYTAFKSPLPANNANTPTFTLHGFAGVMQKLSFDWGGEVEHRDLVGTESVEITDRKISGQIMIEAPPLGTKDFFAIAKAETLAALQIIHGTIAGNIVQLDAPNVQILEPNYDESQKVVMLNLGLDLVPGSAGDDEFKITVK